MGWFGKGKYIGSDRDTSIDRNINNAYGVWSLTATKDYIQNYRWAFPSIAIGATGGTISTVTVGSTSYRVHQFDSTGTFTIQTSSSEPITIECVGGSGATGNPAGYSVNNPGCSSFHQNFGGAGGGASVIVGTGIQLSGGTYTVNVGSPTAGSSFVSPSGTLIQSYNGGTGGNATGSPGSSSNGSGGSGGIAGTTFVTSGISVTTYSGGSGGGGGSYGFCDSAFVPGTNGGNPGYTLLIPVIPSIPATFSVYRSVVGPSIPGTSNRGLGNRSDGFSPPGAPAPGPDSNFSPTGGPRGGIVRIIYKFIQ